LARGDAQAFGVLYDRYARPGYSLALRICRDQHLAEQVLRDAFLAVWRDPKLFDPGRGELRDWLMSSVHHRAVDAVRAGTEAARRNVDVSFDRAGAGDQDETCNQGAESTAVRDALRRLPGDQRRALALSYYGGYTEQEVAAITRTPVRTVRSGMFNAVNRLHRSLAPSPNESTRPTGPSGSRGRSR
jgi:RNA polymerase sigma-70 factor (ECF subfamily)